MRRRIKTGPAIPTTRQGEVIVHSSPNYTTRFFENNGRWVTSSEEERAARQDHMNRGSTLPGSHIYGSGEDITRVCVGGWKVPMKPFQVYYQEDHILHRCTKIVHQNLK